MQVFLLLVIAALAASLPVDLTEVATEGTTEQPLGVESVPADETVIEDIDSGIQDIREDGLIVKPLYDVSDNEETLIENVIPIRAAGYAPEIPIKKAEDIPSNDEYTFTTENIEPADAETINSDAFAEDITATTENTQFADVESRNAGIAVEEVESTTENIDYKDVESRNAEVLLEDFISTTENTEMFEDSEPRNSGVFSEETFATTENTQDAELPEARSADVSVDDAQPTTETIDVSPEFDISTAFNDIASNPFIGTELAEIIKKSSDPISFGGNLKLVENKEPPHVSTSVEVENAPTVLSAVVKAQVNEEQSSNPEVLEVVNESGEKENYLLVGELPTHSVDGTSVKSEEPIPVYSEVEDDKKSLPASLIAENTIFNDIEAFESAKLRSFGKSKYALLLD